MYLVTISNDQTRNDQTTNQCAGPCSVHMVHEARGLDVADVGLARFMKVVFAIADGSW